MPHFEVFYWCFNVVGQNFEEILQPSKIQWRKAHIATECEVCEAAEEPKGQPGR